MIFDLHNDILTSKLSCEKKQVILDSYEKNDKIHKNILAIWTTESKEPIELIKNAMCISKVSSKLCYSIEDLHFADFDNISIFTSGNCKKPFYASLTWNSTNSLGGGALSQGGLTKKGKEILKILEEENILIDTAHLNEETFWDVLRDSKKVVINSHCCFNSVYEHPRNLNDEQIKAIIERGGIIGITLVPKFLSHFPARIVDVFRHIDYFISRFSFKNLAIGTDFFGSDELPIGINDYSDLEKLKQTMFNHGYDNQTIEAIFYKNAQKLLSTSIGVKNYERYL